MPLPAFQDNSLLQRALTHRSYVNEHPEAREDNERLEFLGDAVLDFISGAFVFRAYPEMSEGHLTRLRSALVRTEQLAAFATELELGPLIRLGRGEAEAANRLRPTLLCATFEAILGAYYLDAGIDAVRAYVEPLLRQAAKPILAAQADKDAKSLLQELSQSELNQTPRYRTVASSGPEHSKAFTVEVLLGEESYGLGAGPNKQAAEQAAAEAALQKLGRA